MTYYLTLRYLHIRKTWCGVGIKSYYYPSKALKHPRVPPYPLRTKRPQKSTRQVVASSSFKYTDKGNEAEAHLAADVYRDEEVARKVRTFSF